ncbi:thioesterase family protein [Kitasatospora viridis]|uniref:Holo-[acyl-carrier-protein] synthase n=1 Tax=Kitasatospora viridis TaxID=281105 RepID=A0A561UJ87_9ACTN|nr:thioesterase family protein [Kitasatospora viridis]TWF99407.1 holo-[acyl-carrier-protein] synthase [Kitasatospora viridis]
MTGLGHDLQQVAEVAGVSGLRAPDVFFTAAELRRIDSAQQPSQSLAGAFAAKEALFKALPRTDRTWFWTDAELVHDRHGAPAFRTHGALAELLARRGLAVHVSISHSGGFASAVVLVTPAQAARPAPSIGGTDMFFGETRLTLPVRPNDLDVLGHVNNSVALEYLESGRWHWLEEQGLVPNGETIAVVARTEIDYRAEIPRGTVEVATALVSPDAEEFEEDGVNYRARFRQRVFLPGRAGPAVEALVTVAFLDAGKRSLTTLQEFVEASRPS